MSKHKLKPSLDNKYFIVKTREKLFDILQKKTIIKISDLRN